MRWLCDIDGDFTVNYRMNNTMKVNTTWPYYSRLERCRSTKGFVFAMMLIYTWYVELLMVDRNAVCDRSSPTAQGLDALAQRTRKKKRYVRRAKKKKWWRIFLNGKYQRPLYLPSSHKWRCSNDCDFCAPALAISLVSHSIRKTPIHRLRTRLKSHCF